MTKKSRFSHSRDEVREKINTLKNTYKRVSILAKVFVLSTVSAFPILAQSGVVHAAPTLPNRSATVTSTAPSATFNITFRFDLPAGFSNSVRSIGIEFCDAPLGTCNTTNTPNIASAAYGTQSGWDVAQAFGNLTINGNFIELDRADATVEANPTTDRVLRIDNLVNSANPNTSYYPRIVLYSDAAHTTPVAEGVVAQTSTKQLTVNARVQERLDFCIGVSAVDDATTSIAADCAALTANGLGNTVDIGVVDSSQICISGPSNPCETDNTYNGIAMVRTNAFNGVVVDYYAEQNTSSGALKVPGVACSGASTTDQCFNSQGTTQGTFTAGTERFGMTVAGVNCGSTAAYACVYTGGSSNLKADAAYQGEGTFGSSYTYGTANGYAWDDTATIDRIASSAGSSVKVVEDEALVLKFAATAAITTPTGSYSVTSTYIATATF